MGFIVFEEEAFNYLDAQLENFVKRMDRIRERSEIIGIFCFSCLTREAEVFIVRPQRFSRLLFSNSMLQS